MREIADRSGSLAEDQADLDEGFDDDDGENPEDEGDEDGGTHLPFRLELINRSSTCEEYEVVLPAGTIPGLDNLRTLDGSRIQEVGRVLVCRFDDKRDRIIVMGHPALDEFDLRHLCRHVEGVCGKHVYGLGVEFEAMNVLHDYLSDWTTAPAE